MERWSRRLGPRTRQSAFGLLSRNQWAVAAVGFVVVLGVENVLGTSPLAVPVTLIVGGVFLALVVTPRHGMPFADWLPKMATFSLAPKTWTTPAAGMGVRDGDTAEALPPELGDVQIVGVRHGIGHVGMLLDTAAGTLTAVARVHLHSLGLLDVEDQAQRLDAFRRLLDDLARETDERFRVQLLKRLVPRQRNEERKYIREAVADHETPQARALVEVVEATQVASHEHELFVCVRHTAGRDDERAQAAAGIVHDLRTLVDGFERADVAVRMPRPILDPRELATLIKDSYDPFGRERRERMELAAQLPGVDPRQAWPDVTRREAACYEADGSHHATFWLKQWPMLEVAPGWLQPLTLRCQAPALTVSIVLKPDRREVALKRARRKRTRHRTAAEERRRQGQMETVDHGHQESQAERLEVELANGSSPWFWEGYLPVSAPDRDALADAVRSLESACTECELTPVLLRYSQAEAFTFTLPLARGLNPVGGRL